MALEENVERVLNAIELVYRECEGTKPRKARIIAAAGVSAKTFYRIVNDYPEVTRALRIAEAAAKPSNPEPNTDDTPDDPIKIDPLGAVEELLDTIAELTLVIEAQNKHIGALRERLAMQPAQIRTAR
ncbi:hypothetical protein JWS13_02650 (plasmid) [Rhodococcus pseudokoreensis]|uniref:Uncharacterized protein n=1 Tax=Rhodococcus pseudokoreensis TaxID=2811421 RepID=A0A974VYW4_9NOCA|nr:MULTISPECIES: hypothetical protein [Rhodococcus]QSE86133.1 hypothetical protein JWS14_44670 [Rhodococcus koreensis]QSE87587.1 hypothetical protein JWS13_02650 [Rhodococcus pseudokoreensis]